MDALREEIVALPEDLFAEENGIHMLREGTQIVKNGFPSLVKSRHLMKAMRERLIRLQIKANFHQCREIQAPCKGKAIELRLLSVIRTRLELFSLS